MSRLSLLRNLSFICSWTYQWYINSCPLLRSIEKSDIKEKNTTTFLSPNCIFELKKPPNLLQMDAPYTCLYNHSSTFPQGYRYCHKAASEILISFVASTRRIASWNLVCVAAGSEHLLSVLLNEELFEGGVIMLSLLPRW